MDKGMPKEVALQLCDEIGVNYSPSGRPNASFAKERLKATRKGCVSLPMTSIEGAPRSIDGTRSGIPYNLAPRGKKRMAGWKMLPAGKIAKELDLSPKRGEKDNKRREVRAGLVKGGCSYYNEIKIEINKRKLKGYPIPK